MKKQTKTLGPGVFLALVIAVLVASWIATDRSASAENPPSQEPSFLGPTDFVPKF